MPPLVSIVTPTLNQAAYIEETIRSVLAQEYSNVEYAIVDGGSTDGTSEIIERYADRLAWWTSEPDTGQAAAINRGFARCRGEILGFLNSDDTLLPGAVSAAVEELERDRELLLVYGDNVLVDEASRETGRLPARPWDVARMLRRCENHVPQPGSLFRRRAYELAGPFREDSYYYFDTEFVLTLALHGRGRRLPRALGTYRLHPESKTVASTVVKARDHLRLFDEFFERPDLPAALQTLRRESRSRSNLVAGELFYVGSDFGNARRCLVRGHVLYPRNASLRSLGIVAKAFLPGRVVEAARRLRYAKRGAPPTSAAASGRAGSGTPTSRAARGGTGRGRPSSG